MCVRDRYFFKKPRVPRSLLNQYREGLLLSPACEAGELYRAIVAGQPYEQLLRIADYYDYLEVQPLGNNEFMVRNGQVDSIEAIKNFNRTVIKPVSYTHLDVYKRQIWRWPTKKALSRAAIL